MKAYKGFNKDMTCRGFQYQEGGEYETDAAKVCESGFHSCENPLDCMKYYSPNDGSVYHEVEVSGDIERANDDSKVAATKIKIGSRLSIADIVKAAIDSIFKKSKPTAGNSSNAATAGNSSHAEVRGEESIAAVLGKSCKARGALGCWLVLTERDVYGHILGVQAVKVDGEKYKADTWYELRGGEVKEAKTH